MNFLKTKNFARKQKSSDFRQVRISDNLDTIERRNPNGSNFGQKIFVRLSNGSDFGRRVYRPRIVQRLSKLDCFICNFFLTSKTVYLGSTSKI